MCRVKAIFRPQGGSGSGEVRKVSFEMPNARSSTRKEIHEQARSEIIRQGVLDRDILYKYWEVDKYYIRVSYEHTNQ